jgi:hypothetical protein
MPPQPGAGAAVETSRASGGDAGKSERPQFGSASTADRTMSSVASCGVIHRSNVTPHEQPTVSR